MAFALFFLVLAAAALSLAPAVRLGDWELVRFPQAHWIIPPLWLAAGWLIRRGAAGHLRDRDPLLLPLMLLLSGWGTLMIWRISPVFGLRQAGWFTLGAAGLGALLRFGGDLGWLRRYRYLWLGGGLLLMGATLTLGTNPSGGEQRLWLGCCGVYLQPSEPLRLLLVAFLASYLAERLPSRRRLRLHRWIVELLPLLVVWLFSLLLLLAQRDLGTAVLFMALLATLLFLVTQRWEMLLLGGGLISAGGVLGAVLFRSVQARLSTWLQPWADPIGASYQIVQSRIALASGGFLGQGFGLGAPYVVPAAHTDFILSAIQEEWGLIGAIVLLALFATLVERGFRAALLPRDPFAALLAAGLSVSIGLQAVLIAGGATGLLPIVGVTLPLVSYGGSSLITNMLAIGFLLLISTRPKGSSSTRLPIVPLQSLFTVAWAALALAAVWWGVVRTPLLVHRTDNPRRSLDSLFAPRGSILDREGNLLAETTGEPGSYGRIYLQETSVYPVGFDSRVFGQAGVEASMDPWLRGEAGYEPWQAARVRLLTGNPPPGFDVRLTLDSAMQQRADAALRGRKGALVVLDGLTGDLLALASAPTFNPNLLEQEWDRLRIAEGSPLLDRPVQGRYQPGSALAPFLLAWADERGLARPNDSVAAMTKPVMTGGAMLGCRKQPATTEPQTYATALRDGCPFPFAQLGRWLEGAGLIEMERAFEFDRPPDIRLETGFASAAVLPTGLQELQDAALGQGALAVSPLQMARSFAALIAQSGMPALRLVDAVQNPDGQWQVLEPLEEASDVLSESVVGEMRAALEDEPGRYAFSGRALAGSESGVVAWFMGARETSNQILIIVLVLEGSDTEMASALGLDLLAPVASDEGGR